MKLVGLFLLVIMLSGCAQLVNFAIGTLGNVTGDLIMDEIKEKKKEMQDAPYCDPMVVRNCPKEKEKE